tara:strand:- start:92 stop:913 length:822 start_codon:yes stop_codon:yes gene_type:complete
LININSFDELIKKYNFFLFDQWGVLHNGHKKFEDAEKCLIKLRELKKKVILVSNSSRPTKFSISNLTKIGFKKSLYDYCITSGQIALNNIKRDIYNKYGPQCFPIKLSSEKIKYFNLKISKKIEKANFAMIADIPNNLSIIDFAKTLDKLLKYKLPLLCSNPDYLVYDNEKLSMCGGTVAQLYEDMGGVVYRYGKPFMPIYDDIKRKMCIRSNSKVLVIGDSLWHDIAGGNMMKFDSLWIRYGVHKPNLNNQNEIGSLIKKYKPKFAINKLRL